MAIASATSAFLSSWSNTARDQGGVPSSVPFVGRTHPTQRSPMCSPRSRPDTTKTSRSRSLELHHLHELQTLVWIFLIRPDPDLIIIQIGSIRLNSQVFSFKLYCAAHLNHLGVIKAYCSLTSLFLCSSGEPLYQSGGSGENTEEDSTDRPRGQVSRFLHGNCKLSLLCEMVIYFDDIHFGSDPVFLFSPAPTAVALRPGHHC